MKHRETLEELRYSVVPSPIGPLGLVRSERGLRRVEFGAAPISIEAAIVRGGARPRHDPAAFRDIAGRLSRYFRGERVAWDFPLDLAAGTPFQRRVWQALARIPHGEVRSYEWLAREAGAPGGQRAAGQANGRNPLPIVLPCHRVIRKGGAIGGFGGGVELKRRLLEIEGLQF